VVDFQESIPENHLDNSASILENLEAETLLNLIKKLPDGCRMVFNLFAVEGYSHAEIGKILGISEVNSRSQFHRARLLLKEKIKSEQYDYGTRETPEQI
jgi:RNA polymerase sigma-70 factor (ECF subfamily)